MNDKQKKGDGCREGRKKPKVGYDEMRSFILKDKDYRGRTSTQATQPKVEESSLVLSLPSSFKTVK